jgi:hypothetical protein
MSGGYPVPEEYVDSLLASLRDGNKIEGRTITIPGHVSAVTVSIPISARIREFLNDQTGREAIGQMVADAYDQFLRNEARANG